MIRVRPETAIALTAPMSVVSRLLSAAGVGVAHFVMTLALGPSIHCAEARGCAATDWIQAPPTDVFALPLSMARDTDAYLAIFDGRSFAWYSVANSLSMALLVFLLLSLYPLYLFTLAQLRQGR